MADTTVKKKRKRRKKMGPLLKLFIFLAFVAVILIIMDSALFYVRDFQVSGNEYYTQGQISDLTGIIAGKNLFFETNLKTARNNLLKSPYVRIAELHRKLPGTVLIDIEERREFAALEWDGEYYIVDSEGMVLRSTLTQPALPIISGLILTKSQPGFAAECEQSYLLGRSLTLLERANETDFYFERIQVQTSSVKAYIYYDNYYCDGELDNMISYIEEIKTLVANHYANEISHGTIYVGSNGYLSFAP